MIGLDNSVVEAKQPISDAVKYDYDKLSSEKQARIVAAIARDTLERSNDFYPTVEIRETFYTKVVKRLIDIIVASAALLVSFPVNLVIGIVTYFDVGRPIFFVQKRMGKDKREFPLIKFRNMNNDTDENGVLLRADLRVTKWGKFVRSTSLDELLNFVSILKGDMTLIGPRPLPVGYSGRFNRYHDLRHKVKPGLDCPLQDPSQSMTWENRLNNDVWYAQNVSFATDVKLIWLLVREVLFGKDKESRSNGSDAGTFMGYFEDGTVMDSYHIPKSYFEDVFDSCSAEQ